MLTMDQIHDIRSRFFEKGENISQIATTLNLDWKTVQKYVDIVQESQLDNYLGNDKRRFQSLVNTKSKSRIRIDKNLKREPTHLQVLEFLRINYFNDVIDSRVQGSFRKMPI